MEGRQRWRLWKLQGFLQTQPHLSDEHGTSGTAAHRTPRIQVGAASSSALPPRQEIIQQLCRLCSPRQYSVGFEMVTVSTGGDPGSAAFQKKNSGDYRYDEDTSRPSRGDKLFQLFVTVKYYIKQKLYSSPAGTAAVFFSDFVESLFFFFFFAVYPDVVSVTWSWNTSQQASTTSSPPPSCPNRKDRSSWTLPALHL